MQHFEKFPKLTAHIRQYAVSGRFDSWSEFLSELNEILSAYPEPNPTPPASAVEEAERMYPFKRVNHELFIGCNDLSKHQQLAHITCAGMYTDTIDKLKNDVANLEAENKALIEEIQNWKDELKDQAREYRNNR